jgi:hypothetical protein
MLANMGTAAVDFHRLSGISSDIITGLDDA